MQRIGRIYRRIAMDITLTKANLKDAENIHKMQVKAFI